MVGVFVAFIRVVYGRMIHISLCNRTLSSHWTVMSRPRVDSSIDVYLQMIQWAENILIFSM